MKLKIRVPATSANLGPGFDVAGLALSLYNTFEFELIDNSIEISGIPEQFNNSDNLIVYAFNVASKYLNFEYKGLKIDCKCDVPDTRGLGSSSTCIVAGIVAAFAFSNKDIDDYKVLELATKIEGHPDNVAPAIFGGVTVSIMDDNEIHKLNIPIKNEYKFIALIPNFTLSTEESRSVLPDNVKRSDAIKNVSQLGFLVASLINGYDKGLKWGFQDYLHQPYRGKLIKNYNEIMDILTKEEKVLGAFLSGAGPTIMVLANINDNKIMDLLNTKLNGLIDEWKILELELDKKGYTIDYK